MGGRPTIQMVAELAGVSRRTVDRVLNDRPHVNEAVRQRVLAAMRELGYLSPPGDLPAAGRSLPPSADPGGPAAQLGGSIPDRGHPGRPPGLRGAGGVTGAGADPAL